jgi:carboxymethylenebutenolidase
LARHDEGDKCASPASAGLFQRIVSTKGSQTVNDPTPIRRKTAKDFPHELLELYDYYAHGIITKREFLDRAAKFAVGGLTAAALLNELSPDYALAQQVAPDDPAIETSRITYESPNGNGTVNAYLVRPAGVTDKLPAVLVVHENRGLNPYIEDVARRLGKAGFMAMAPDGLTSVGGYPGNDDQGRELQQQVDPEKLMNDFFAGFEYLMNREDSTGKVGAVGFCYGGGVVNAIAVAYPELAAAVPFYGRQPPAEDVAQIQAPLLIHYGELDERINEGWPAFEEALKANGKTYTAHVYPGANHGFHNDTTPRYDQAAAELAEERTIEFFKEHLVEG